MSRLRENSTFDTLYFLGGLPTILLCMGDKLKNNADFLKHLLLNGYATPDMLKKIPDVNEIVINELTKKFEKLVTIEQQGGSCFFPKVKAIQQILQAEKILIKEMSQLEKSGCDVYFKFK